MTIIFDRHLETTMKAIIQKSYGNQTVLQLEETEKPIPKDDEVFVKISAAAINDYDWSMMQGKPYVYRLMFGIFKPKHKIAGMELSGVIKGLGESVTQFSIGDAVYGDISAYGFGGFAEYTCINENALQTKPEFMSFTDAAAIPHAGLLAAQGLIDIGKVEANQKVLINGAGGGVGTFALQIAKHYGAEMTGVDTGTKLTSMESIGYDHVIDYKMSDFTQLSDTYDLIFDTKSTRSPFQVIRVLKPNGKYITVGGNLNRLLQMVLFKPLIQKMYNKQISVLSLKPNEGLAKIEQLYHEGIIKPLIDGPYQLGDTPRLVQYFGDGLHKGKIIIEP